MIELLPSILAADFSKLGEELREIEQAGVKIVHIDVMDGSFVPSISLGMPVIASMRKESKLTFDVHLMVEEPDRYVEEVAKAGADIIGVHAEACRHLHRTVTHIKDLGKKVCVVLNPATPLSVLDYVWSHLDQILLMTVNPGFGGQTYLPEITAKICALREKIEQKRNNILIEVDGGIKLENVRTVLDAGANLIVAGSSVFGSQTTEQIKAFQKIFSEYEENKTC